MHFKFVFNLLNISIILILRISNPQYQNKKNSLQIQGAFQFYKKVYLFKKRIDKLKFVKHLQIINPFTYSNIFYRNLKLV